MYFFGGTSRAAFLFRSWTTVPVKKRIMLSRRGGIQQRNTSTHLEIAVIVSRSREAVPAVIAVVISVFHQSDDAPCDECYPNDDRETEEGSSAGRHGGLLLIDWGDTQMDSRRGMENVDGYEHNGELEETNASLVIGFVVAVVVAGNDERRSRCQNLLLL